MSNPQTAIYLNTTGQYTLCLKFVPADAYAVVIIDVVVKQVFGQDFE